MDALLEGIGEGFFALDRDWRFTAFNRAAEGIFGLSRADVIGKQLWEVSPGVVGSEFERRYRLVMTERTRQEFEAYSVKRPDRYHEIRAFPFADGIGAAFRDITHRKSAETAAQASADQLRAVADALPLLISYVDRDEVFRFANKTYEAWFERPLSDIVGRKLRDIMDADMLAAREPFVARALAGETVTYEADFPRRRQVRHTEIVHVPHRLGDRVVGMYSVVQDVTERKLAEKVLAESEARFRSIANSAPVPIWVTGLGGRRDFVNRAYQDFLGVSYEEAVKFDWRNALHSDDLTRIMREQVAGESSLRPFTLEARYRSGDGRWRWLRSESQPRWSPTGEHIGFIGVAHDITSSKEAEQKLTEFNHTLQARIRERTEQLTATQALVATFFNHSSECHAVLTEESDGRFRYEEANPATLKLYGKTREEVVGRTIDEIFGAAEAMELDAHLTACLASGRPYSYERPLGEATIEAIATPAPGEAGGPRRLIVSAHDVTERRRLERQLRQSQKMEAVGQLTGGVAHDFNNLLTLVMGGLEGIGRLLPNLPDSAAVTKIERFRDMALQGAQRAAALTSRLLAFSRQQSLSPQTLDANRLVAGLCELLQHTLGETIVLETTLAPNLWPTFADPNQLENALLNLALNARDAMPRGGALTIATANAILEAADVSALNEPVAPGEYVAIAVTDTGTGMDAATRERAFDPFFTTKSIGKGTGLGLSQAYGFARQSSGHVRIRSELGQGTTVAIYLPRRVGASIARQESRQGPAPQSRGSETILLVEDDEALRSYGKQSLQELGYRVLEADSGVAAAAVLDTDQEIDLLLTDIVMPGGVDGAQLADLGTHKRPGLRVLFMTGYTPDPSFRSRVAESGKGLIGKPFSFAELAQKVRDILSVPDSAERE